VRDDAIRERLRARNPWWRTAVGADPLAWVQHDETLRELDEHDVGYRSAVLDDIEPGGLYVLRGPRRVGKSVVLKRLIETLLQREELEAWNVIYLALSDFSTQDLRRSLALGRSMTERAGDSTRYWVLDEITAVRDWTRVLKDARDETSLRGDTVVVTGSSARDLDLAQRDLGAGRVGRASDPFRLLLPMSFREAVAIREPDIPLPAIVTPDRLQDMAVAKAVAELDPFVQDLDLAWQSFLEVGGFPRAVAEQERDGRVSEVFCRDLSAWLAPDITDDAPPESILQLLAEIGRRMTSPLDVKATGEALGLGRTAMQNRVNRLRSAIAAVSCPQVRDGGEPISSSQAKLYIIDPLLAQLPVLLDVGRPGADMTQRSEAALAITLARSVERVHGGRLIEGRAIGYARTLSGNEIDFAPMPLRLGGTEVSSTPLESKWVSDGWRSEALVTEGRYGRGVLATKTISDTSRAAWAIPAPIVCLLLG
jgi:hypothetical protein